MKNTDKSTSLEKALISFCPLWADGESCRTSFICMLEEIAETEKITGMDFEILIDSPEEDGMCAFLNIGTNGFPIHGFANIGLDVLAGKIMTFLRGFRAGLRIAERSR